MRSATEQTHPLPMGHGESPDSLAEELERAQQARRHLDSVISHDFRTPLSVIQGFSEMIRDEEFSLDELRDFAISIHKSATQLDRLITRLLDVDRLESGSAALRREMVDLNAILTYAVNLARAEAGERTITVQLDDGIPFLLGDPDRLAEVITNLLENALAYSSRDGEVRVSSRVEDGVAHVCVEDRGFGIPAEALEAVFDRYARLDARTRRYIRGTGLGLPLVRQIVRLHGGTSWAESTPGQGSVFHVTIPLEQE